MKQYVVTGMSCAACSARVEKAVKQVSGVESCSVSLLTNSMGVEGEAIPADVIQAVVDAGYGASLKEAGTEKKKMDYSAQEEMLKDKETPILKKRLVTSLGFLAVLMYFSLGNVPSQTQALTLLIFARLQLSLISFILCSCKSKALISAVLHEL